MAVWLGIQSLNGPLAGFLSVSMGPGLIRLTVMQRGPKLRARPLVKPSKIRCLPLLYSVMALCKPNVLGRDLGPDD
jgi:hypothetical protein